MASPAATPDLPPDLRQRRQPSISEAEVEAERQGGAPSPSAHHQPPRPRPASSLPARAWAAYSACLASNPLLTRALTAGVLAASADACAQALLKSAPTLTTRRRSPLAGWRRTAAGGAWGVLVSGPAGHAWQGALDMLLPLPGGSTKAAAADGKPPPPSTASATTPRTTLAARVAVDALVFSPAVNALALAFIFNVIEGGGGATTAGAVRARLPATQATAWRLWPAASLFAYALVPPPLRVLWFNAVGFWWTLLLSGRGAAKGGGALMLPPEKRLARLAGGA